MKKYSAIWSFAVLVMLGLPPAAVVAVGFWTATGDPINRWPAPANDGVVLANGEVMLTGGGSMSQSNEVYDPTTASWFPVADTLATRSRHATVLLDDGRVLVAGGCDSIFYCTGTNTAEVYDPATDTWATVASMNAPRRSDAAVTPLIDGRVLVVGGSAYAGAYIPVNPVAEVYDPVTDTWEATGAMVSTRTAVTVTPLADGRVLAVGIGNTTELYDPLTNSWAAAGNLQIARALHVAASLTDGRVLVVGGLGSGALSSAEVYDPATDTWSVTAPPGTARSMGHTATVLANGWVLIAGGKDETRQVTNSAELFNPVTGTWFATAPMADPRVFHFSALLLTTGQTLVVGGLDFKTGSVADADLFSF